MSRVAVRAHLADAALVLSRRLRRLMLVVPLGLLFLYFGYHALHGQRGLLAYFDMRREVARLEGERDAVVAEERALKRKNELLSPQGIDPDVLAEELNKLGYVRPDEVIVLEPKKP
jgi:cell division protein FtsB